MTHEIVDSDPLVSAIGELRKELLLWIDTELARMHEQVEKLAREDERFASPPSRELASSRRLTTAMGYSSSVSAELDQEETAGSSAVERNLPAASAVPPRARPPVARSVPPVDEEPRPFAPNPRDRLDALARLLDHRLKQAQDETDTREAGARERPNRDPDDLLHSPTVPEGRR